MKSSNFFCRSDQAMQYSFLSFGNATVASGDNVFRRSKTVVRTGFQRDRERERETASQTDRQTDTETERERRQTDRY